MICQEISTKTLKLLLEQRIWELSTMSTTPSQHLSIQALSSFSKDPILTQVKTSLNSSFMVETQLKPKCYSVWVGFHSFEKLSQVNLRRELSLTGNWTSSKPRESTTWLMPSLRCKSISLCSSSVVETVRFMKIWGWNWSRCWQSARPSSTLKLKKRVTQDLVRPLSS